jgi:glc operon protein GlcG
MNGLKTVSCLSVLAAGVAAAKVPVPSAMARFNEGPPTVERQSLTLAGARLAIDAAKAAAERLGAGGAIALVDDSGNLLAFERLDGTFAAGADISIGKARTSALFKKPTLFFEEVIAKGRTAMAALTDFTPLQGGVPLVVDGQVVGGIGVSGAMSAAQDEELALAGVRALEHARPDAVQQVAHLGREQVEAAFARGETLLDGSGFRVDASRRDAPGEAELHTRHTDVYYVLAGSAELVIGGEVVASRAGGSGELRGSALRGGSTKGLVGGEVVVVPAGTPHWFKSVSSPLTYYVVKIETE